jgi:GNAT superfamily N-acetyltransferase
MIEVRLLAAGDAGLVEAAPPDLFDDPVDAAATRRFLADPRHAMAAAIEDGVLVGFASAVRYAHPDKAREQFWVNEVAVLESHRRQGLGKAMMAALEAEARRAGCFEMWVGTEVSNAAARSLYAASGGVEDAEPFVSAVWRL